MKLYLELFMNVSGLSLFSSSLGNEKDTTNLNKIRK
jgi:hypothetical protein